jgi:hypothetical protein
MFGLNIVLIPIRRGSTTGRGENWMEFFVKVDDEYIYTVYYDLRYTSSVLKYMTFLKD